MSPAPAMHWLGAGNIPRTKILPGGLWRAEALALRLAEGAQRRPRANG